MNELPLTAIAVVVTAGYYVQSRTHLFRIHALTLEWEPRLFLASATGGVLFVFGRLTTALTIGYGIAQRSDSVLDGLFPISYNGSLLVTIMAAVICPAAFNSIWPLDKVVKRVYTHHGNALHRLLFQAIHNTQLVRITTTQQLDVVGFVLEGLSIQKGDWFVKLLLVFRNEEPLIEQLERLAVDHALDRESVVHYPEMVISGSQIVAVELFDPEFYAPNTSSVGSSSG